MLRRALAIFYSENKVISPYIFLALLCPAQSMAVDITVTTPQKEALPSIEALEQFEDEHGAVSQQVVWFANWIDNFFGDDRVYDESQKSHIKLYLLQTNTENQKTKYDAQLKAKLILPKTKKRLNLLIESSEDANTEENQPDTLRQTIESQEQSLALRFIQKETEQWNIHTDAGLRFRSGIDTLVRFRMRRLITTESWAFRISENVLWYESEGLSETTRLDSDHSLTNHVLFRSTTQATWKNINGYFDLGQDFFLFQNINSRRAITYQAGVAGISYPDVHATNYVLSVRYREKIHKNWLFFDINPIVTYPEESDFTPIKSILFRLEIIFGII